jgi:ABC-type dipeptide/oligopeptide/nickel transport system permease component
MNAIKTFAIDLGETSEFRGTREQMLAMLRQDFGVTAVKRGYTTWRIIADGQSIGRIDEM